MKVGRRISLLALGLSLLTGSVPGLFGQGSRQTSEYDSIEEKDRDNPAARDAWFMRGRTAPAGESAAGLRYKAYQQKLQMRRWFSASPGVALAGTGTPWTALGPSPMISSAYLGSQQDYNLVSGRATAVAIDPSDATGNTVYIGGAHGGVWKSTNAANPTVSAVTWTPVADFAGTLAVGSIAIKPGNSNPSTSVVLVGTGEPNNSADSYYGLGFLRSTDGGNTWTAITTADSGSRLFAGMGVSKIAFSTANPNLVVASVATASAGLTTGLDTTYPSNRGLYYSTDAGASWHYVTAISDPGGTISPVSSSSVVYNTTAGKFFAALRYHGIYSSSDGINWTRLTNEPANLTTASCPVVPATNNTACPIYRAELAVVPGRDEMYTWVVTQSGTDGGIWRTTSSGTSAWAQLNSTNITVCGDGGGCGVSQGSYNLEIAALPNGAGTDIYAGTINIYKCTVTSASPTCSGTGANTFKNLTHVYGCSSIAKVHPDQHHLAGVIVSGKQLMYFANDGGIYRALDGYTGLTTGTCGASNAFDSLNGSLGSLTQFVSISTHPTDSSVILGGTQDNGSPTTHSGLTPPTQWQNVHAGDGGYNAISPGTPNDWFTTYPDGGFGSLEVDHCGAGTSCDALSFNQVVSSFNLGNDDGAFYFPYILDPQAPNEMIVGTCRVWRVDNAAAPTAFNLLSQNFDTGLPGLTASCSGGELNTVRSLAAGGPKDSKGFSKVIYAGTDGFGPIIGPGGGKTFVTTDASVPSPVFTEVTGNTNPGAYPVADIAIDTSDTTGRTAFIAIMGFHVGHVFKTTSGGAGGAWTDFSGSGAGALPDAPANSLVVDSQAAIIYVGTDVGVFSSPTSAPNWTEVGPVAAAGNAGFLPNVPVTSLRLFNAAGQKLLRASTYGRGVWQYALVTTPDYAIAVDNTPLTVFPGQTSLLNGTLTAGGTYNSAVTLTCTAGSTNPPATCTPPAPVTPTLAGAAYSVGVGGAIGDYSFNIHGVGADSSHVTHDAAVTLHVVDFAIGAPTPASALVAPANKSNPVAFTVSASGAFSGTVNLACNGLPAGATCTFSPSAPTPTSSTPMSVTLFVNAASTTPPGTSSVTISATTANAPAPKTQALSLAVGADYQLTISNTPLTAIVNAAGVFPGTLIALDNYNSPVHLSCGPNAPPTCTVTPATVTPTPAGASFTVTVQSNVVQAYDFSINAVGTDINTASHFFPVTFSSIFSFTLADSTGTQTVQAGQSATYTLTFTPPAGVPFPGNVQPLCETTDLPLGSACSFNPAQINAGSTGAQTMTLTISTLGPNSKAQIRPVARNTPLAPFFVWVPLAGLLLGGFNRGPQKRKKMMAIFSILLTVSCLLILPSCGGGGGGGGSNVSVSVSPPSKTLFPTQTQQFTASVSGTSNTAVTWTASGGGTIDTNGMYTAPNSVSTDTNVTVTATSQADTSRFGRAALTLKAPTPSGSYTIHVTTTGGGPSQTTTVGLAVQ